MGVWLFFALSAFLLSTQLIDGSTSLRDFITGRVLRILPPFVVAIIFYRLVGTLGIDDWSSAWHVMVVPVGHLWTIPAELSFYLFLPFIVAALLSAYHRAGVIGAALALALTTTTAALIWSPLQTPPSSPWCGWYAINFLSGVGAAFAAAKLPRPSPAVAKAIGSLGLASILGFITFAELRVFGDDSNILMNKHFIIGPFWAVVVYAVFVAPPGFLTMRPMVFIGRWSFSIYLFHWGIGAWAGTLLPAPLAFLTCLGGSIAAGYLGHRFIERPTFAVRRWLGRDQRAAAAAKTASI